MHIGLVVFIDFDSGLDLANALHDEGLSVTLYLSHKHVTFYMDEPDRPLERLYERGLLPTACKARVFRFPRWRDPRSFVHVRRIAQTLLDDGVDVVHILMGGEIWLGVLSLLLRCLPVAATMIVPKPNIQQNVRTRIQLLAAHKLLAYGSDVIIVNGAKQVPLVENLYGVAANRIAYVPLAARTTAVRWSAQETAEDRGTVLFFGAARLHKGLKYLVQAQPMITRRVPHARILIASRGQELERCRRMIQDPMAFEIHKGFVPGDVMATYFQRASVVTLPYLSASTSGILLTAYGFGKPVVATNVGCLPEYVEAGSTGLLVPPADVEQLADAISRLLMDDSLRHRMGENALIWVENNKRQVVQGTLTAYEKSIKVHNGFRKYK